MPPEPQRPDWKRLARLLAARRVEIAPRYANRRLFCEERDLNRRMLWRIETGDDDNYSQAKIDEIEDAYLLVRGSLLRTVAGGELEALPAGAETAPAGVSGGEPAPGSPADRGAWTYYPGDDMASRLKRMIIRDPYASEEDKLNMLEVVNETEPGGSGSRRRPETA